MTVNIILVIVVSIAIGICISLAIKQNKRQKEINNRKELLIRLAELNILLSNGDNELDEALLDRFSESIDALVINSMKELDIQFNELDLSDNKERAAAISNLKNKGWKEIK